MSALYMIRGTCFLSHRESWTLLGWGNRLAACGGTLRVELQHPPFKKLSKNPSTET